MTTKDPDKLEQLRRKWEDASEKYDDELKNENSTVESVQDARAAALEAWRTYYKSGGGRKQTPPRELRASRPLAPARARRQRFVWERLPARRIRPARECTLLHSIYPVLSMCHTTEGFVASHTNHS